MALKLTDISELGPATFTGNTEVEKQLTVGTEGTAGTQVLKLEGNYSSSGNVKLIEFYRAGGAVAGDLNYTDATTDMEFGTSTGHSFSLKANGTRALTITSPHGQATFKNTLTVENGFGVNAGAGGANVGGVSWSSTNTGFLFAKTGGATKVYLNSAGDSYLTGGNVGIGTNSPGTTLQIGDGSANVLQKIWGSGTAGIQIFTNSPTTGTKIAALEQYFSNEGYLGLRFDGTEKVRLRANDDSYINGGSVGIGTATPRARLESYGAIISQSANVDPDVTLTNTGSWGVQAGGTIRVMQGFSRSGIGGDEIIFTYAATSWKSWSLDYTFTSTNGLTQGTIGGYWNNSGGQNNVENIDNHQTSVGVTHSGQSNIISFEFSSPGTHINCSFVYTQSGGDGAPRGDRVTIETISATP